MIHLPIIENRIAQFAAQFEPLPDGRYAYFAGDRDDGVPVSAEEYQTLVTDYSRICHQAKRAMLGWLVLAIVVNVALMIWRGGEELPGWLVTISFILPFPWAVHRIWQAGQAPAELAGRRVPVAPPRGASGGAKSRLAALPISVPLAMTAIGLLLIWRLWADGRLLHDWLMAVYGGAIALFGLVILSLRRR